MSMQYLAINLCTRGRPQLLPRTIEGTLANIVLPTTTLMVSLDEDDAPSIEVAMKYIDRIAVSVKPREDTLGEKYNRVLKTVKGDVYLVMVDYAPIITKGFDRNLIEAASIYPDGYACLFGPLANLSFACTYAVTAKLAQKMGGIFPPYFPYWFVDHWLDDIARMIDRVVYVDVVSDFWSARPGTMERREPGFWGTFYDATAHLRENIAASIINDPQFDETPARKTALLRNFAMIRQRSQMINENCRANNDQWDDPSRDERYWRVKANAQRVLNDLKGAAQAA